ncbi:hypothetical protein AMATHDRAFT_138123 [Amanita thiersii Skay4041]|uniref:Actin-domain-containing protein n=1 Tax=Amanita thiersii Skay4041 TaxID=703135 RepID=A0A2A9NYR1_9AGAR|nr:hypothetical protein AMATHDRAFT_138123 [Amanita thiersii Skay4041]
MSTPTTPRSKTAATPTTPAARLASSSVIQSSPHYTTTRRHSLYGVEDRVIIDPGSRVWKVGFSGEGRPRDLFYPTGRSPNGGSLWSLKRASDPMVRVEEDKLLEVRLQKALRSVFHESLLTDPKARKVILVEHPLLPIYIKDTIARILFENQVPSVSFASSHLLSLFAVGRITGLVIDCGHLESVALPIFAARPLYPQLRTTPMAGARLTSHLRALLLKFATYLPPPTSLSSAANIPAANRATRVPQEVLTDAVVEEIKTRCCFVGNALDVSNADFRDVDIMPLGDQSSDIEAPQSDSLQSESGQESTTSSQRAAESEFSEASGPGVLPPVRHEPGETYLQALASMYTRHSTATDLHMRVTPPTSQQTGTGLGTLIIPGWIRERAAEVLFEGGDVDESSVAEVILDSLLRIPVDLRKTMASSILVIGGTAMLPGFILRLQAELIRALASLQDSRHSTRPDKPLPPVYDRYAALRPLIPYFAILNNPSPPPPATARANANAGKAPALSPAMMAWVGGSLAGALKTGGVEIAREKWDEAELQQRQNDDGDEDSMDLDEIVPKPKNILPDWTRSPLTNGAPPARQPVAPPSVSIPPTPRVEA